MLIRSPSSVRCVRDGDHQPRGAGRLPAAARAARVDPQYLVTLTLWDNLKSNQEPLLVKDIAALLQIDSATLSPMLKRLQSQGLITRTRSAADERTTQIELTPKGARLRRRALKMPPAVLERPGQAVKGGHFLQEEIQTTP
jgi:DNA-binding MarR family transcriptional regulator